MPIMGEMSKDELREKVRQVTLELRQLQEKMEDPEFQREFRRLETGVVADRKEDCRSDYIIRIMGEMSKDELREKVRQVTLELRQLQEKMEDPEFQREFRRLERSCLYSLQK
nr:hypothetical protein BaRGS_025039 [Batillaria attramentaria]